MGNRITLTLPIRLDMGVYKKATKTKKAGDKKTPFALNLNTLRNAPFHKLNDTKKMYKLLVQKELERVGAKTFTDAVFIEYKLFTGNKRLLDVGNIISVVQKYFEDAFVELGYIEDDNYMWIPASSSVFGGIDKGNERVEITIESIHND